MGPKLTFIIYSNFHVSILVHVNTIIYVTVIRTFCHIESPNKKNKQKKNEHLILYTSLWLNEYTKHLSEWPQIAYWILKKPWFEL